MSADSHNLEGNLKRSIIIAGLVAGGLAFMPNAFAEEPPPPSERCGEGNVITEPSPTGGTQNVCVEGVGGVEASGNPAPPSGYVVADGDEGNDGPLDGYVGIEGDTEGAPRVVGSCSGDHNGSGAPIQPGGDTDDCVD